jgi:hypothetical protein
MTEQNPPLMSKIDMDMIFSDPFKLICYLKTTFDFTKLFEKQVRHYTIEKHTFVVLQQFESYFAKTFNDSICNINLFRFFLALHDIGKPIAFAKGDKAEQYKYTVEIIRNLKGKVPFTNYQIELTCTLAGDDPLGVYFQDKLGILHTADAIRKMAEHSGIAADRFFRLLTIYYQCDTASYTKDSGGIPFLERLFLYRNERKVFNPGKSRLEFSKKYDHKFGTLEAQLKI